MPQQSVSPRHFLDQAFWGLILSICVIMGGGICVLGFGKKVPNATDVAASDQRKSAPARAGTVVPGSRRPPGKIDEPRTAHRPSHRPATRTPEAGEAREPTELAATGRSESLDSANTIGIGPIEPDDSGAPAVDIRSVSSSASQFAGIEQRLDRIANNLGTLRDVVTSQQIERRTGADQSVEFVREFRQLLDSQRVPAASSLDQNRSSLNPQSDDLEPGDSVELSTDADTNADTERVTQPELVTEVEDSTPLESDDSASRDDNAADFAVSDDTELDSAAADSRSQPDQVLEAPPELVNPSTAATAPELRDHSHPAEQIETKRKMATLEALDAEGAQDEGVVDLPPPFRNEADPIPEAAAEHQPTPTSVKVFRPRHVSGEDLASKIEPYLTPGVGKLASTEDETGGTAAPVGKPTVRQPAVAVKDTAETLVRIAELVEQLDTPTGPGREFQVDVTAVGVRLQTVDVNGINLHDLGHENPGFALHSITGSDGMRRCATGLSASAVPASSNLKLAVLSGEENRMLQELRHSGPLQAVARSRVTMRDREASRLVVELDDAGVAGNARVRCLGVRPRLRNDGSVLIEILPCADEAGRPIEASHEALAPIGEISLQAGESAIMAGLIDESHTSHRPGSKSPVALRRGTRAAPERTEWLFVVSPRPSEPAELTRHPRRMHSQKMTAER